APTGNIGTRRVTQKLEPKNMLTNLPTWTTDRVELLKSHFEAGLTCREIAASIGVSRNAVIGKLARLQLTRGPARAEPRPTKAARERTRKSIPRLQYQILQAVYENAEPLQDEPSASEHRCQPTSCVKVL